MAVKLHFHLRPPPPAGAAGRHLRSPRRRHARCRPRGGRRLGPSRPGFRPPVASPLLALGDSLAFGYSQAKFNENLPAENPPPSNRLRRTTSATSTNSSIPACRSSTTAARGRPRNRSSKAPASTTGVPAPPPLRRRTRRLAALRRARLPGGAPGERQPDHDRHRRQRCAGADQNNVQTGSGLHRRGGAHRGVPRRSAPTSA